MLDLVWLSMTPNPKPILLGHADAVDRAAKIKDMRWYGPIPEPPADAGK
ncbi:MAG: hypothetical protein ACOZHQ_09230 [Thermodesulfobacteriota bacterium]